MANKIQVRRGLKSQLPSLSAGEPAYTTDTRELFIGTGSGNVNMGGSQWYTGTAISGTSTTTGAYSYSACPLVKVGDCYLNTSYGYVYQCTTAGSGTSAKWTYQGCIKGAQGATGEASPTPWIQDGPTDWSTSDDLYFGGSISFNSNGYLSMDEVTESLKAKHRAATIVIGTTNSSSPTKDPHNDNLDYICDGTDDQEQINAAISALPANGGKIVLREGIYNISASAACNKDVVFEGMGNGTVIYVADGASLINNTAAHNITFRDMAIEAIGAVINTYGLFKIHSGTELHIDNSDISILLSGSSSSGEGTAICANGTVYCSNARIYADAASSYCYIVFRNCCVYASSCSISVTRENGSAAIFHSCTGTVSGGSLTALGIGDIMHGNNNISISACRINCHAITVDSSTMSGEFTGCSITIRSWSCCASAISNCKLTVSSDTFIFRGYIFTNNRVINSASNTFYFDSYSIVKDNISKYTLSSTTPSGGKMSDNVVCSSLS